MNLDELGHRLSRMLLRLQCVCRVRHGRHARRPRALKALGSQLHQRLPWAGGGCKLLLVMGSGHKPVQELGDKLRNEQQKAVLLAEVALSRWDLEASALVRQSRELRLENRRLRQRAHHLVSQWKHRR